MGVAVSKGERRLSNKKGIVLSAKEKVCPSKWIHQFKEAYGKDPKSQVELADFFNSELAACTTARELSAWGLPSKISHAEFVRILAQVILVPRLSLIYRECTIEYPSFTEGVWLDFLEGVQHESTHKYESKVPSGPIGFASYIYSEENSLIAPEALHGLRLDEQFTQHYVKCLSFPVCWQDAAAFMEHLTNSLRTGTKWLYVPVSVDNNGMIRCFKTWIGAATDELPLLESVLGCVGEYLNASESREEPPVFIHIDTTGLFHNAEAFDKIKSVCQETFGEKLDCPFLDSDSPPRLKEFVNKVCIASPSEELASFCHFQVVSIGDINQMLASTKPKGPEEYYKLMKKKILALSTQETLSFVGGLAQICAQMFVTVVPAFEHTAKPRSSLLVKGATQHLAVSREALKESELQSAESIKVERKPSSGIVFDSQMAAFSPARAWKSGVQAIPITAQTSNDNYLQEDCIFQQNNRFGFVPVRVPKLYYEPLGNHCELRIELVSMLGVQRGSKESAPFVKMCCDSGNGLKQIAISAETDDNGISCAYHMQTFNFKFEASSIMSCSHLSFHLYERNLVDNQLIAWNSVPIWTMRGGIRAIGLKTKDMKDIPGGILIVIVSWELEQ